MLGEWDWHVFLFFFFFPLLLWSVGRAVSFIHFASLCFSACWWLFWETIFKQSDIWIYINLKVSYLLFSFLSFLVCLTVQQMFYIIIPQRINVRKKITKCSFSMLFFPSRHSNCFHEILIKNEPFSVSYIFFSFSRWCS